MSVEFAKAERKVRGERGGEIGDESISGEPGEGDDSEGEGCRSGLLKARGGGGESKKASI